MRGSNDGREMASGAALVLAVSFLVIFVGAGARFAIGLTLKPMAEELGWSRSTVSLAVAAFQLVSAVCMFLAGRFADRFSLRLVLGAGLALGAIGIGGMSLVLLPWQAFLLYGGVFAIGNGIASLTPVGVMVSHRFPNRTGLANAVATSGIGAGQLLMIAGLAAVLVHLGWRAVYAWLGIASLLLVPIVLAAIRDDPRRVLRGATGASISVRDALRTRRFWLLAAMYAICGFQDFFVSTHVVAFAEDRGVDTLLAGNLLALMGLTGVVGVLLAGAWSDRSGPVLPTLACFSLRLAIFLLIIVDGGTVSVAAFALLYGATFAMTAPLTVIFTRDAFGLAHLGALSGLIGMIHHIAGGAGALTGGALFDVEGDYATVFILMFGLSVAALVLTWQLRAR